MHTHPYLYRAVPALLRKWPALLFVSMVLGVSLALLTDISTAAAITYGGNAYGQCAYSTDCPTDTSNLDVIINVNNNQTIPESGYEVIIIPKGQDGVPLQQAEIFINGQSIGVKPVRPDGTIHIFVQPPSSDGGRLQLDVVVTGQDGSKITKHYIIRLSALSMPGNSSGGATTGPASFLQRILRMVHQLPNIIKYLLPYLLFIILAVDCIILILFTRREIEEQNKIRRLIERERQISSLKQTFVALTSHYLRSPLAILNGGVDLLASLGNAPGNAIATLQTVLADLRSRVEALVKRAATDSQAVANTSPLPKELPATSSCPMLLIPLILIGLVAFTFDYLAVRAGDFDLPDINVIIQVVIFGSLAIVLYVAVRVYQLQRRELTIAKRVLADEQGFNGQRDTFIAQAATELRSALSGLDTALAAAGTNPASKFLDQGQKQLHSIANKLGIAERLKGSEAQAQMQTTQLSALYATAMNTLNDKAAAKKVRVMVDGDHTLNTSDPQLVSYMLQTLLDNAIDYSPADDTVTIVAHVQGDDLRLSVTDQGSGIDPQRQFALFEAFSKLEGAETFNREGMGFSLYLDRLIATYLHGNIELANTTPHGARATIILPVAQGN